MVKAHHGRLVQVVQQLGQESSAPHGNVAEVAVFRNQRLHDAPHVVLRGFKCQKDWFALRMGKAGRPRDQRPVQGYLPLAEAVKGEQVEPPAQQGIRPSKAHVEGLLVALDVRPLRNEHQHPIRALAVCQSLRHAGVQCRCLARTRQPDRGETAGTGKVGHPLLGCRESPRHRPFRERHSSPALPAPAKHALLARRPRQPTLSTSLPDAQRPHHHRPLAGGRPWTCSQPSPRATATRRP